MIQIRNLDPYKHLKYSSPLLACVISDKKSAVIPILVSL